MAGDVIPFPAQARGDRDTARRMREYTEQIVRLSARRAVQPPAIIDPDEPRATDGDATESMTARGRTISAEHVD